MSFQLHVLRTLKIIYSSQIDPVGGAVGGRTGGADSRASGALRCAWRASGKSPC